MKWQAAQMVSGASHLQGRNAVRAPHQPEGPGAGAEARPPVPTTGRCRASGLLGRPWGDKGASGAQLTLAEGIRFWVTKTPGKETHPVTPVSSQGHPQRLTAHHACLSSLHPHITVPLSRLGV